MNKVVFIGDMHGHDTWKDIVKKNSDADHFVFLGDYFDSFSVPHFEQIINFKEIIEFKKKKGNVTLLIGNHDFHYMPYCPHQYGGYNYMFAPEIGELLRENSDNLQVAWQKHNVLVTHAGVSRTWFEECFEKDGHLWELADRINGLWEEHPERFNHSGMDSYGNSEFDGPFWIRPQALKSDPIDSELIQIVGHTQMERIDYDENHYFIDTLPREYLNFENDEFIIVEM